MPNKIFLYFLFALFPLYSTPVPTPLHLFPHYSWWADRLPFLPLGHVGDYPFPTEITFQAFANHVIDPCTESFDPESVKRGDTVFIFDWHLSWFTKYVHPHIQEPYILITSDTDMFHPENGRFSYEESHAWPPSVDAIRTLLYDSKVAAWFAKNLILSRHPKLVGIPIGPHIQYWKSFFDKATLLRMTEQQEVKKQHLAYLNINPSNHSSRQQVVSLFQDKPFVFSRVSKGVLSPLSRAEYYKELQESYFTLAPRGYGIDICRFWEAALLGTIPIVLHSELDDLYSELPVLFVDEWEEITAPFLQEKLQEIQAKEYSREKAFFSYWLKKIVAYQAEVRNGSNSFSSLEATRMPEESLDILRNLFKTYTQSRDRLFVRGSAMGLRLFEIVQRTLASHIYVSDGWGAWNHEEPAAHLAPFTDISKLGLSWFYFTHINFWEDPYAYFQSNSSSKVHTFFDLTYRRHTLKEDLEQAEAHANEGCLVAGNMALDEYVRRVVTRYAEKRGIEVRYEGDIWFFVV